MKRISLLIVASILGSAITILTSRLVIDNESTKTFKIEHISDTPVVGAAYTVNTRGEIVPLQFTDVAKKVMPAVVHIKSTQMQQMQSYQYRGNDPFRDFFGDDMYEYFFGPQNRRQPNQQPQARVATGSGVIINSNGYIVTNNHVIANADDIEVGLEDNRVYKAKVVGVDPSTDLALLQIKEDDLPYVPLVNSDEVEVGEWVLAVGNPFNLNSTVTAGIVSAKGRNINILQDKSAIESFIQTDAAINPGNSGGALVNLQGGLVGINTAIASPTGAYAGYGFAVPANIVSKVVADLKEYGMVQRGFLGIVIRSVDGNLAKEEELNVTEGVYVDKIGENSAAGDAGIKEGDVIIKVNELKIKSTAELLEIIGRQHPGDKVAIEVNRKGKALSFDVVLRNKDGKEKLQDAGSVAVIDKLGVEIDEIDAKTAKRLNIKGGIIVNTIGDGIIGKQTRMKPGFIITKIDGKEVNKVKELTVYLDNKKGGVMVEGVYEDFPGVYYYAFGL